MSASGSSLPTGSSTESGRAPPSSRGSECRPRSGSSESSRASCEPSHAALLPDSAARPDGAAADHAPYGGLVGALAPGSIVAAETLPLRLVAPAYGLGVVAPGRPTPFVDGVQTRLESSFTFLQPDTTDERRRAIAQKYGIEGVLCATQTCRQIFADDDVVAQGPGWTLFRLPDG